MRIVFSKDRAAQLDLLLGSLERNAPMEETVVVYRASSPGFLAGYQILRAERHNIGWRREQDFEAVVRRLLAQAGDYVTWLCDDDILFRPFTSDARPVGDQELCFSLRLGANTTWCYPPNAPQPVPARVAAGGMWWPWETADGDFGYPGSLDGHTFRTNDLVRMLDGQPFGNPTELEDTLTRRAHILADERPLMACYDHSVLVSVPMNRVSEQSQVRHGDVPAEDLNARFLDGWRIDYDALDFTHINAAHVEVAVL